MKSWLLSLFNQEVLIAYGVTAVRIILIIAGLALAGWLGKRIADGLLRADRIPGSWSERRVDTIRGLVKSLLRYILYFFGAIMVLSELKVNTTSILAGAGIVGLAAGFGAQNLVRDVITGFFILFEDQYAVGDYVTVAGVTGTVEEMGLRVTKLREGTGEMHIIPNGEIKQVTNFSRGGIGVNVDVTVAYEENLERVTSLIEGSCEAVSKEYQDIILEPPQVLGVTSLGPGGVTLSVFGKVKPMQQWTLARELRRRIKDDLDAAGVELPYPRQVVLWKEEGGEGGVTDPL